MSRKRSFLYALLVGVAAFAFANVGFFRVKPQNAVAPADLEHHDYLPPKPSDSRSPCPALNTLANHGYLPRSGRGIGAFDFIYGLQAGYDTSPQLAWFLTFGAYVLLSQYGKLSLEDIARHGYIEHLASLVHADPLGDIEYAPKSLSRAMLKELLKDSADGKSFTPRDVARARVRREASYTLPLDGLHAEIARGEMALVLGIFGNGTEAVPVDLLEYWWTTERFPPGWRTHQRQTLWQTFQTAAKLRADMRLIEKGGRVEVP